MTWCFAATSFLTVSGVAATRVSPGRVSAGMPILMPTSWLYSWHRSYTAFQKRNNRSFFYFPARCQGQTGCVRTENAALRHAAGKGIHVHGKMAATLEDVFMS